jgi:hypothetical protein
MDMSKSSSASGGPLQGEGDVGCHVGQAVGWEHQEVVHEPIVHGRQTGNSDQLAVSIAIKAASSASPEDALCTLCRQQRIHNERWRSIQRSS